MKFYYFSAILATFVLAAVNGMSYDHHLVLKAGVFDVYWKINVTTSKINFKYVAKTTGWAALGWTQNEGGAKMIQYDIALGGVKNGNETYLNDYYSFTAGRPDRDNTATQSLTLISATESGGFTTVEFSRDLNTGDTQSDVKIQNNTKTWIVWAINENKDITDPTTFASHTQRDHTSSPYNMFTGKAMSDAASSTAGPKPTSGSAFMMPSGIVEMFLTIAGILVLQFGSIFMLH